MKPRPRRVERRCRNRANRQGRGDPPPLLNASVQLVKVVLPSPLLTQFYTLSDHPTQRHGPVCRSPVRIGSPRVLAQLVSTNNFWVASPAPLTVTIRLD